MQSRKWLGMLLVLVLTTSAAGQRRKRSVARLSEEEKTRVSITPEAQDKMGAYKIAHQAVSELRACDAEKAGLVKERDVAVAENKLAQQQLSQANLALQAQQKQSQLLFWFCVGDMLLLCVVFAFAEPIKRWLSRRIAPEGRSLMPAEAVVELPPGQEGG